MNTSQDSDLETFQRDRALFMRWMKDNGPAVLLCEQLMYVCHLWDDLIDGDNQRGPEHINSAFWMLLVEIPQNPFYLKHFGQIQPLIVSAINDWHIANRLEKSSDGLDIAYTLRCNILSIVTHCAYLCGGPEWAAAVGAEIRRYGQSQTLDSYKEEHPCPN